MSARTGPNRIEDGIVTGFVTPVTIVRCKPARISGVFCHLSPTSVTGLVARKWEDWQAAACSIYRRTGPNLRDSFWTVRRPRFGRYAPSSALRRQSLLRSA